MPIQLKAYAMSKTQPFDLEQAIATWRQFHARRRVFSREDLDELEQHLRDHVAQLSIEGIAIEAAFEQAITLLGDIESGTDEYQKVRWAKLKHKHQVTREMRWWGTLCGNYLKVAWRNLNRHKGYTLINGIGLVTGMTCCLLLVQYAVYEYSFDRFNTKHERLFRGALKSVTAAPTTGVHGGTGYLFGPTMHADAAGIARFTRVQPNYGDAVVSYTEGRQARTFKEQRVLYVDSTFMQMFDYPMQQGHRLEALNAPQTVLLSATLAQKYFEDAEPLGKRIQVTGWVRGEYIVVGVFEDVLPTSHLQFDMLLPMVDLLRLRRYQQAERGWDRRNFATYFELEPHADVGRVEQAMLGAYVSHQGASPSATNPDPQVKLQPLLDVHLNANIDGPAAVQGDRVQVALFALMGALILLLALVNYVNLATARALDRSREVGVRKAMGAPRRQLMIQFLLESATLNGLALCLAVGLALLLLPVINQFANVQLTATQFFERPVIALVVALFVSGTLLAGAYPALVLSSFQPSRVLKSKAGTATAGIRLRKILVVVQFAASIGLIGGAMVIYQQVHYMRDVDTGFNMEQVLVIERPRVRHAAASDWASEMEAFKQELLSLASVQAVGASATTPGRGFNWYAPVYRATADPSDAKSARATNIDHDFADVYGVALVAGEPFREGMPLSDGEDRRVLVNETLVRRLGFASNEAAVDEVIRDSRGNVFTIHGVLQDFMWSSAHDWKEAVVLLYETRYGDLSLSVRTEHVRETLASIQAIYDRLFPGNPFVYTFADEAFATQYRKDEQIAVLISGFAILALVIACLGLVGLAAYTVSHRTKEIGVRKVVGASSSSIVFLLSKHVLVLVGTAFMLAVPVSYVVLDRWLSSFPYRIELEPRVFLVIGGAVGCIALLAVSVLTIRAALANPVDSLRYE